MVLGGLGHWCMMMLDCMAFLAPMQAVLVVLGGLERQWVILLASRAILTTA